MDDVSDSNVVMSSDTERRRRRSGLGRKTSWWAGGALPVKMHWITAGVIFFSFAMPSGVVGVSYSIGAQGIVLGCILSVVITAASSLGSNLLLYLWLSAPSGRKPKVFGDFGKFASGKGLQSCGNVIQLVNFVLFMPVAFDLVKDSLRGVYDGFTDCSGAYTIAASVMCLLSTQIRSLPNATVAAYTTALLILLIIIIQVVEVRRNPIADSEKNEALLFGNGEKDATTAVVRGALGATAAIWAYVPAFLTAELASVMRRPSALAKSLSLSASMNIATFCIVGTYIVYEWGWDVENPMTLTNQWMSKVAGSFASKALNAMLLFANLTAYTLDSIPVATMTHKRMFPKRESSDEWTFGSFFVASVPSWTVALALALVVPNLFDMLAFATAFTTPWATMVYPAACYLAFSRRRKNEYCGAMRSGERERPLISDAERCLEEKTAIEDERPVRIFGVDASPSLLYACAWFCLLAGFASGALCLFAAFGQVSVPSLRGKTAFTSFCT